MNRPCRFMALPILLVFIYGCASLSAEKMVPEHSKMNFKTNNYTLKIGAITANYEEGIERMEDFLLFGDNIKLEGETLKEAITVMMEQSLLFKKIVQVGSADYELNANIDLQGQRALYSMTIESLIRIHYELVKISSNVIVWKDDFNTTGGCTIQEAYPAVTRTNTAVERAVRKNLLKCINEISQHLNHSVDSGSEFDKEAKITSKLDVKEKRDEATHFCENWIKLKRHMTAEEVAKAMVYPIATFSGCKVSNEVIFVKSPKEFMKTKNVPQAFFTLFNSKKAAYNLTNAKQYSFIKIPCFYEFTDCKLSDWSHHAACDK